MALTKNKVVIGIIPFSILISVIACFINIGF